MACSMFETPYTHETPKMEPFQLPMHYLDADQLHTIQDVVSSDLELLPRTETETSIYHAICAPQHVLGEETLQLWNKEFTSNIEHLTETQDVISHYSDFVEPSPPMLKRVVKHWRDFKQDTMILERYGYMEWNWLKHVNHSPMYLECISVAQLISPLLTLILPIFILFFPFILLQIRGIEISFSTYISTLKTIAQHHFFGKIINLASSEFSLQNLIYAILTTMMFAYSLYSNTIMCQHFYNNIKKMNNDLIDLREYLTEFSSNVQRFNDIHKNKKTYHTFCQKSELHSRRLQPILQKLKSISPFQVSLGKVAAMGELLQIYYELYDDPLLHESIEYSFGFQGYLDNLRGISQHLLSKQLSLATFADTSTTFRNQYYPLVRDMEPVKNNLTMKKNIILTGPNASGKTTILKSTLINIIVSQQWGCGFYTFAKFRPFTHIHSYLNIPDSSGRDSLFQAESRRCKEILDIVNHTDNKKTHHFCIFDELYSGTNYKEATKSAAAFLKYLSKFDNVEFILTTHYRKLCKHKSTVIENYKMDVIESGEDIQYTYRMKRGVSKVEGGIRILKQMNYPSDILAGL